jgi:predicted RNA-binding protein with PUA-like domain
MAKSSSRKYWLFKSEPECFSVSDLEQQAQQTTYWDGVRNYQARNFLRDEVKLGDHVLFYHSNADPLAIVGVCEVVREGYADFTAFDETAQHYDEKSDPEQPTWFMVDIKLVKKFPKPLTREELSQAESLKQMELLRKGSRLSIQPVTATEYSAVLKLAGVKL